MISFIGNCTSITKVFGLAITTNENFDDEDRQALGQVVCGVISSLCDDYAEALGLTEAELDEAMEMVQVIENKLNQRVREAKQCG
jgi:hypothetical protein